MVSIELKESLARIEFTREKRLKEDYPKIPEDEKNVLVKQNYANFVDQGMCELLMGPNKGDRVPKELAELLGGNSLVDPDRVDLGTEDYDVDVLVLGSGGAGAAAALSAHEKGAKVLLVTKLGFFDSDTMEFEGGIQAATKRNDSPVIHYLDTVGGGFFENTPDLVEVMVRDAPSIVQWLESLGCIFDKELSELKKMEVKELRRRYNERDIVP